MDFFTRIAEHTPQLNKNDNELLSYCIRNHTEIANLKVTELADRLFISPASVVRFCKKLGFSGYSDFKASLRMDLFEPEEMPRKSHPTDFFRDIHKTIEMVPEETVERIVELIHCSRRIELYAVGSSRMPGSAVSPGMRPMTMSPKSGAPEIRSIVPPRSRSRRSASAPTRLTLAMS